MSAIFEGTMLDASLIQLLDLRFFAPDDPRFLGTMSAVEAGLRRGSHMLRYATEDDFGLPETAEVARAVTAITGMSFNAWSPFNTLSIS